MWVNLFIFALGISVGSFLNVLIDRIPNHQSVFGRSHCDHCGKILSWFELIPIVSFLVQKGSCRSCWAKISLQNPLLEAITGLLFLLLFLKIKSFNLDLFFYLAIFALLLALAVIDLKTNLLPDELTLPAIVAALFYLLIPRSFPSANLFTLPPFFNFLSALAIASLFYLIVKLTHERGMGGGDVKLAFLMGLVLGFPKIVIALYLAFLTGALVSLMLIALGKKRFGQTIPFGPFLVLGTYTTFFFDRILLNFFNMLIFGSTKPL